VQVGSPAKIVIYETAGSPTLHKNLEARNHQQKTLVVAHIWLSFAELFLNLEVWCYFRRLELLDTVIHCLRTVEWL
jgi:hypothetical protein